MSDCMIEQAHKICDGTTCEKCPPRPEQEGEKERLPCVNYAQKEGCPGNAASCGVSGCPGYACCAGCLDLRAKLTEEQQRNDKLQTTIKVMKASNKDHLKLVRIRVKRIQTLEKELTEARNEIQRMRLWKK